MFSSGLLDYQIGITKDQDRLITLEALNLVTDMSIYGVDNFNTLDIIANIICGAKYIVGEGEIVSISDDEILTTLGSVSYDSAVDGSVVVSAGTTVTGISLLTRIVTVSRDGSLLPDIKKINERMIVHSSSPSRIKYLKAISQAISKRKYTILLPSELFSRLGKDGITMLTSVLNTAISSSVTATTILSVDDTARGIGSGVLTVVEIVTASAIIEEMLKVDLKDDNNIDVQTIEQMVVPDNPTLSTVDEYIISMTPLILDDIIRGIDSKLRIVEQIEDILFSENLHLEGEKSDHTITHVSLEENPTIHSESALTMADGSQTYNSGSVMLSDTISGGESQTSTIQAYITADILLREKRSFILKRADTVIPVDSFTITTTRSFFATGNYQAIMETTTTRHEELLHSDTISRMVTETSLGHISVSTSSTGIDSMHYEEITIEEAKQMMMKINDLTVGLDESTIIGENKIDEI